MRSSPSKPKEARQRILDVLEADRKLRAGNSMLISEVARKVGLEQSTAGRYLLGLWKNGRLLRRKAGDGKWAYRFVREGEDIEKYKNPPQLSRDLQACDG